jgi:uncharacterized membrane protein YeaQ/YmgE (transglycosylase-associated protein family)
MGVETIFLWVGVGLIGGWLASAALGRGPGLLADLATGVVGAVLGGLLFRVLGIHRGLLGLPSTFFVAFVAAVVLLVVSRLLRRDRGHARRLHR